MKNFLSRYKYLLGVDVLPPSGGGVGFPVPGSIDEGLVSVGDGAGVPGVVGKPGLSVGFGVSVGRGVSVGFGGIVGCIGAVGFVVRSMPFPMGPVPLPLPFGK